MSHSLTDIAINLTNKQFQNDTETIIQNAIGAKVSKMILTGTSVKFLPQCNHSFLNYVLSKNSINAIKP